MRSNLKLVRDDVPLMQLERRIERDRLLAELSEHDEWAVEILAWLVVFGCLLTACILAWAMGRGMI